ncbi:MAG: MBL fold metallo-hydrolase [Pyrinomonadaceae bacterium]|nr:MBL fold metallo-hydrolase [Pyrinomonadaceae bacterium]MBP6214315.1 MBL fold metallo-hydrolase [Pyrinomonadaceae bacterium]
MEFGDYRIGIIPDTEFKLDGGAMFGVVPRVVWERVCPPDDLNRIAMNMNCLFIDTGKERILVETGIGEKWTPRKTAMYGIDRKRPFAESLFEITGSRPEDITIVVNTHLHFDHAGGNTVGTQAASLRPQFPNARYLVSRSEFEHAENPHERDRASYLPDNWRPVQESGQLELMPDEYEVVPGLKIEQVRGHSETMQTVRLESGGRTLYGFADLIPTRHHLSPAWIAGFDLYPVETLEFKKKILPQAVRETWLCLFYHDTHEPLCTLTEVSGKIVVVS